MHFLQRSLIFGTIIMTAVLVFAQDAGFRFQVRNKVLAGKQLPAVVLFAGADMRNVRIKLTRSDGKHLNFHAKLVRAGQKKIFEFRQKKGRFSYQGKLTAMGMDQPFSLSFDCLVVGPLKMKVTKAGVDLDNGLIRFQVNRTIAMAKLKIVDKKNAVIFQGDLKPKRKSVGCGGLCTWVNYRVTFPRPSRPVGVARLEVLDEDGFYAGVQMEPFFVRIPHQEVEFDFGKWAIRPDQEPKLKQSLASIRDALKRLKTDFQARLYIAGYTDTVGSNAENLRLSTNRARSIARWFVRHGVKIAVFYQGFGEVLRVATPDNTPESRNRRVSYVLSAQAPGPNRDFPAMKWKRIR